MSSRWGRSDAVEERGGRGLTPDGRESRDRPENRGRPPRPAGARGEARDGARRSLKDRLDGALLDVAVHRGVAYRDIADRHFGGHPYAARRGVDRLIRAGYLAQSREAGPKGGSFLVLHATPRGADAARSLARTAGLDPDQRAWSGLGRKSDLVHDTAVYRAAREHRDRLAGEGARVTRTRLDAELRGIVARRSEEARVRGGARAADAARRRAARELGLPVLESGKVLYPDAQVEYLDRDGNVGRVNIEIATEHYKPESVASKAKAGFAVHGANGRAGKSVRAGLALAGGRGVRIPGGDGGGGGPMRDDPASVEL